MLYVQALVDDWQFPPTDPAVRVVPELRLIAPTVAISQLRVGSLLEKLRNYVVEQPLSLLLLKV